ncbi:MAG: hypothetical protein JSS14_18550 [Proteobacteria bacterium]|nr:hypothetical protein [Pseudomonadota bacterium]
MASNATNALLKWTEPAQESGALAGRLAAIDAGRPVVEFDAGHGPQQVRARVLQDMAPGSEPWAVGQSVLLVFERGDTSLPVIVGRVADVLPQPCLDLRGDTLNFEGREQVVLRCGEASVTLRADGQVIVKGSRLLSRASESNKIRGATVLIN